MTHSHAAGHSSASIDGLYPDDVTDQGLVDVEAPQTFSFTFNDDALWLDSDTVAGYLHVAADRDLLLCETFGGRLAPPGRFVRNAVAWLTVPDAVSRPVEWMRMLHVAAGQAMAASETPSYDDFVDDVEELLVNLHPSATSGMDANPDDGLDRPLIEVTQAGAEADVDAVPCPLDWCAIMQYADFTVDKIQVTYPGHGHLVKVTFEAEGRCATFEVRVPASRDIAELFDHHNENVDAEDGIAILAVLNAVAPTQAAAMVTLAHSDESLSVRDHTGAVTGGVASGQHSDGWTLLHAAAGGC